MVESPWQFLAALIRPQRRSIAIFAAVLVAATTVPLAAAVLLARFVRLAGDGAAASELVQTAVAYAGLGLISSGMSVLVTWRANITAWSITNDLRYQLTNDVLRADLSFHRDRTPGELVTRVDADITSMTKFIASVVAPAISIVALGIGAIVVCFFVQPALAPSVAIGCLFVVVIAVKLRDYPVEETIVERAAEADVMSAAEQYLTGAEDIASLGAGRFAVARLGDRGAVLVRAGQARVRRQMGMQGAIRVSSVSAEILVIGTGAWLMTRGRLDVAGVILGYRLMNTVSERLSHITWRLQDAQGASGAARRVMELTTIRGQVRSGSAILPEGQLEVRFTNTELIYDDDAGTSAALKGLDLVLPPGRLLGVVGRTGSGKTSLARLLLRLVEPTGGTLTIGGIPIDAIDEDDFRRRVTAVPQDVQLFPGTVEQNVSLFADRPRAAVIAALEDVGLGDWLAGLPEGLDTQLAADDRDDSGTRTGLSAGQAQLLALSRALLRNPSIVVLDEATSRIDPATQSAISEAMRKLVHGRTAIVIAHRLETLDVCDDIAVLADGRLVEHGDRLILSADTGSRYAHLRSIGHDAEELI